METFTATQRKACELANISRSSYRYRPETEKDEKLKEKLTHLAHQKPRYGYRRLGILLRREGEVVNHKRLFRVYHAAGLSVKRKKRKRLVRVGLPAFLATRPNQQWSMDFVHDRMGVIFRGDFLEIDFQIFVVAFFQSRANLNVGLQLPRLRVES